MGTQQGKEQLFTAIETNNTKLATHVLQVHLQFHSQQFPELLNAPMRGSKSITPLQRSAWRGDIDMVMLLLEIGADPNLTDEEGLTPLMWAAKRDHTEICIILMRQCDLRKRSLEALSALDYAILIGNYASAYMIYEFTQEVQTIADYQNLAALKSIRYVHYPAFLQCLRQRVTIQSAPDFLSQPKKPPLMDPVYDSRETWKERVKRILNFEPPPMVESVLAANHGSEDDA